MIPFVLKGILIGFSIAAPVGPIGALCIRRTLASGRLAGLLSGLGAATADAFYGLLSAGGLTVVSGFLLGHQTWLRLFGGVFLGYLGIKTFFTKPAAPVEIEAENLSEKYRNHFFGCEKRSFLQQKKWILLKDYSSTFLLTLTNPTLWKRPRILMICRGSYPRQIIKIRGLYARNLNNYQKTEGFLNIKKWILCVQLNYPFELEV